MAKATVPIDDQQMKQAVKEALREKFAQDPQWFRDIVVDVLADMAMVKAIRQGRKTTFVSRADVFRALESKE